MCCGGEYVHCIESGQQSLGPLLWYEEESTSRSYALCTVVWSGLPGGWIGRPA